MSKNCFAIRKKLIADIFILIFLFTNCSSSEDGPTNVSLVSISVEENAIQDNHRLFYYVTGINGEDLGSGELFNSDEILIEDNSYKDSIVALTVLFENPPREVFGQEPPPTIDAYSYLDIPIKESVTIGRPLPFIPDTEGFFRVENQPLDYETWRISPPGFSTVIPNGLIPDGFETDFNFFPENPFVIVTLLPIEGIPEYQTFNFSLTETVLIDLAEGIPMETNHIINSNFISDVNSKYVVRLSGLRDNGPALARNHTLYMDSVELINSNQLSIFSTTEFSEFSLRIDATKDNYLYRQTTNGEIPSIFDFIDPEIEANGSFSDRSFSVNGTDNVSYISLLYDLISPEIEITWEVIAPKSSENDFSIDIIPINILEKQSNLNQINSLNLTSIDVINLDDLDYEQALKRLLELNNEATSMIELSKRRNY